MIFQKLPLIAIKQKQGTKLFLILAFNSNHLGNYLLLLSSHFHSNFNCCFNLLFTFISYIFIYNFVTFIFQISTMAYFTPFVSNQDQYMMEVGVNESSVNQVPVMPPNIPSHFQNQYYQQQSTNHINANGL